MPSYAFAIGNVRMYLQIEPKTRTNRRFSKTRPDARTKAKKEDVSGETRTYAAGIDKKRNHFTVTLRILRERSRVFVFFLSEQQHNAMHEWKRLSQVAVKKILELRLILFESLFQFTLQ